MFWLTGTKTQDVHAIVYVLKNRTKTMETVVGIISSFQWKAVYIPAAIPEGQVSQVIIVMKMM